jgi:hypothetical protein
MSDTTQDRLARIAQRAGDATYLGGETQEVADDALAMHAALTAVLALHRPEKDEPHSLVTWEFCSCGAMEPLPDDDGSTYIGPAYYPCATVRAINDALGGE